MHTQMIMCDFSCGRGWDGSIRIKFIISVSRVRLKRGWCCLSDRVGGIVLKLAQRLRTHRQIVVIPSSRSRTHLSVRSTSRSGSHLSVGSTRRSRTHLSVGSTRGQLCVTPSRRVCIRCCLQLSVLLVSCASWRNIQCRRSLSSHCPPHRCCMLKQGTGLRRISWVMVKLPS